MTQNASGSIELNALMGKISDHMQFLGYEVKPSDSDSREMVARHPDKANIIIRVFPRAITFTSLYGFNSATKSNRLECLEYVNSLNMGSIMAQYSANDYGSLVIQSWFFSAYDKIGFGQFLGLWDDDFTRLFQNEGTAKFLE